MADDVKNNLNRRSEHYRQRLLTAFPDGVVVCKVEVAVQMCEDCEVHGETEGALKMLEVVVPLILDPMLRQIVMTAARGRVAELRAAEPRTGPEFG